MLEKNEWNQLTFCMKINCQIIKRFFISKEYPNKVKVTEGEMGKLLFYLNITL